MIRDAAGKSPSGQEPAPAQPATPTTANQQPAAEVLISAARQRARGLSWELIAEKTPYSEGDLLTFALDHPEIWGPLYARAEKLRLQETEGQGLAHLTALLKGDDEVAAEKAGRELLIHRRHVQRSRGDSRLPERRLVCPTGGDSLDETTPGGRDFTICHGGQKTSFGSATHDRERWFAQDPAPEKLHRPIIYAANRVAHGEDYVSIAGEVGRDAGEIARWAFIYPRAWDRVYPQARLTAAQFGAALAINRLLDLAAGPDAALAARAGRTLLIHRRHMHWARENPPQRHRDLPAVAGTEKEELLHAARASSRTGVLLRGPKGISVPQCLCGERSWRSRDGPG